MASLDKCRNNRHSQNGEDGVITEICVRLHIHGGAFVEFGAWDGKHLSNAYRVLEEGSTRVYIEGDNAGFDALLENTRAFSGSVQAIQCYVGSEHHNNLDTLLATTRVPPDFKLLSVDIDSRDSHVWQAVRCYRPKVVIVEITSSISVGVFQTHRNANVQASRVTATVELGKHKGYVPVCPTGNLIFVRDDDVQRLRLPNDELLYPELLFNYLWIAKSRVRYSGESEASLPPSRHRSRDRPTLHRMQRNMRCLYEHRKGGVRVFPAGNSARAARFGAPTRKKYQVDYERGPEKSLLSRCAAIQGMAFGRPVLHPVFYGVP